MTQERDGPGAGQWYSERTHHFNLSLIRRPASARGRFEAMDGDYCGVGDLFFIPGDGLSARHRRKPQFLPRNTRKELTGMPPAPP